MHKQKLGAVPFLEDIVTQIDEMHTRKEVERPKVPLEVSGRLGPRIRPEHPCGNSPISYFVSKSECETRLSRFR